MKKNIFLILIVFFAAFSSCGTEELTLEKKTEAIEFSQIAVEVQTDKIIEVSILKGVAPFSIVEIDRSIARVNLKKNKLRIRGMKEGKETELKIKGADGSPALLTIKVIPREKVPIEFSEQTVELNENDKFELTVIKGDAPFTILELDKSIAAVLINENLITIEGVKKGETTLKIRGFDGSEAALPIKVNPLPIKLSKDSVELFRMETIKFEITQGAEPYSVGVADGSIAEVSVEENFILVKGLKEGETLLTVSNEEGARTSLLVKVLDPLTIFKEDDTSRVEFASYLFKDGTFVFSPGTAGFGHSDHANLHRVGLTKVDSEGNPESIYVAWSGDTSVGRKATPWYHTGADANTKANYRLDWLEVVQVKNGKIWVVAELAAGWRKISIKVVVPM